MPVERRTPAVFMFHSKREEIRLDTRPTTEDASRLPADPPPVRPERKSGVELPPKVSELRGYPER